MLGIEQAPNTPSRQLCEGGSRRKSRSVDVAAIEELERDDCIERWWQVFGVAPPKYTSLEFMRKALAYETQVKAFGGHSNAVQRALKASLKAVRSKLKVEKSADTNFDARAPTATVSYGKPDGVTERLAPNQDQTIQHKTGASEHCVQIGATGMDSNNPSAITQCKVRPMSGAALQPSRSLKSTKPSVLSIRAGTHLVREWNGRTYQVEALEKGFRLDGKTYRSLSAIAKKITGAHWSGPRFFGLES